MIKIACFGVGVNSVAGILHYGSHSYDEIIFSDTGSEKPETYEYLKFLNEENKRAKNWLHTQGWQEGEPFVCLLVRDDAFLAYGDGQSFAFNHAKPPIRRLR